MRFVTASVRALILISLMMGTLGVLVNAAADELDLKPVVNLKIDKAPDRVPAAQPDSDENNKGQPFIGRPTSRTVSKDGYIFDVEGERDK